jgi:hypothetical protein
MEFEVKEPNHVQTIRNLVDIARQTTNILTLVFNSFL